MSKSRHNYRVWSKKYRFFDVAPVDRDIVVGGDGTIYEKFDDMFAGESFENYRQTDDYEVDWSTGLIDKNGVEMYEGDIVRILYTDWISKDDSDPRTLEVYLRDIAQVKLIEWNYNGFYVCSRPAAWHETMEHGTHGYIEVIGNLRETPELLERK